MHIIKINGNYRIKNRQHITELNQTNFSGLTIVVILRDKDFLDLNKIQKKLIGYRIEKIYIPFEYFRSYDEKEIIKNF